MNLSTLYSACQTVYAIAEIKLFIALQTTYFLSLRKGTQIKVTPHDSAHLFSAKNII